MTTTRAAELVRLLGLAPHPEGGSYQETFRSEALTHIHFLLDEGERSRWHRVDKDEVWQHLEGGPLELLMWKGGADVQRVLLGPVDPEGARPSAVVPAGVWQAARPLLGHVLCGCSVAPAFQFEGFALLAEHPGISARLRSHRDLL